MKYNEYVRSKQILKKEFEDKNEIERKKILKNWYKKELQKQIKENRIKENLEKIKKEIEDKNLENKIKKYYEKKNLKKIFIKKKRDEDILDQFKYSKGNDIRNFDCYQEKDFKNYNKKKYFQNYPKKKYFENFSNKIKNFQIKNSKLFHLKKRNNFPKIIESFQKKNFRIKKKKILNENYSYLNYKENDIVDNNLKYSFDKFENKKYFFKGKKNTKNIFNKNRLETKTNFVNFKSNENKREIFKPYNYYL